MSDAIGVLVRVARIGLLPSHFQLLFHTPGIPEQLLVVPQASRIVAEIHINQGPQLGV